MNFIDQLDPELRVMVEKLATDRPMNLNEIPKARAAMKKMVTAMLAIWTPSPLAAATKRPGCNSFTQSIVNF